MSFSTILVGEGFSLKDHYQRKPGRRGHVYFSVVANGNQGRTGAVDERGRLWTKDGQHFLAAFRPIAGRWLTSRNTTWRQVRQSV